MEQSFLFFLFLFFFFLSNYVHLNHQGKWMWMLQPIPLHSPVSHCLIPTSTSLISMLKQHMGKGAKNRITHPSEIKTRRPQKNQTTVGMRSFAGLESLGRSMAGCYEIGSRAWTYFCIKEARAMVTPGATTGIPVTDCQKPARSACVT